MQKPDFSQPVSQTEFYCLSNVFYVKDKRTYYKIHMSELYGSVWSGYEIVISVDENRSDPHLISCYSVGALQTRKKLSFPSFDTLLDYLERTYKDLDEYLHEVSMDEPPVPPTIKNGQGEIEWCLGVEENVMYWVPGFGEFPRQFSDLFSEKS